MKKVRKLWQKNMSDWNYIKKRDKRQQKSCPPKKENSNVDDKKRI